MEALENTPEANLTDTKQSFWHLSAIQLTSLISIPVLSTSLVLIQKNSFLDALATIILSNLILWIIRYAIIKMSYNKRKSAIDLAKEYLGEWGSRLAGLVFLVSAILWFNRQAEFSSRSLLYLWPFNEGPKIDLYTQYSIIVGCLSTIFCAFGIKLIKWLSLISFPCLLASFISIFAIIPHNIPFQKFSGVSISGLVLILGVNLALTVDLPTFFRHSRSKQDTFKALTLIQLISLILSVCALYFGSIIIENPELIVQIKNINSHKHLLSKISLPILILISTICANVFNIYACSVGWEVLVPKRFSKFLLGSKEYAILGLSLTAIFISPLKINHLDAPIEWIDNAEVSLCFVFIVGWIIRVLQKRRPILFEKCIYVSSWIASMIIFSFLSQQILLSWLVILLIVPLIIFTNRLLNYNKLNL